MVAGEMEELDRLPPEQRARLDELLGGDRKALAPPTARTRGCLRVPTEHKRSPLMPLERGLLFASRLVF